MSPVAGETLLAAGSLQEEGSLGETLLAAGSLQEEGSL